MAGVSYAGGWVKKVLLLYPFLTPLKGEGLVSWGG